MRAVLRRSFACVAALGAVFALAVAPAPTSAAPVVGIGEQYPGMFASPWWRALAVRHVYRVVPWDGLRWEWQRAEIDSYMMSARAAGAEVLLGFGHSRSEARRRILPSPRSFRREFLSFRARYPWVREYVTWNEANHCSQPTCRRPDVAARYYNLIRRSCPRCTIVAADVLDGRRMPAWVRAFRRRAEGSRVIWGLHNYIDANRFRTRGTLSLLRTVTGEVWFTETGGLVRRKHGASTVPFPENAGHAARATRWIFHLARLSPCIKRVYFYQWDADGPDPKWDSGLLSPRGTPRPAYRVVRAWLKRAAARRRLEGTRARSGGCRLHPASEKTITRR